MRIIIAAIIAGFTSIALLAPALASDKLITVTGEAMITAAPDRVTMRLGVGSQGKTAREASQANATTMTTVIAAIKAAGAEEQDVQTTRITLQPVFEQKPNGPPHLTGFRASNDVTVKLNDIGKLAGLIDRAVAAGANEMSGIEFGISDQSKRLDEARSQAIADARRKAEIYATAAGVVVGRPVSIAETSATPPPRPMSAASFRASPTPVAAGELALQATVSVSFELAQ